MKKLIKYLLMILVTTVLLFVGYLAIVSAHGTEQCPVGFEHKYEHSPYNYTTSGEKHITEICVKAGTEIFEFFNNTTNNCYMVDGIGTQTGKAVKVGEGR